MFCNCSKKFSGSKGNLCLHQSQLFLGVARGIVLEFLFFILWTFIWPVIWILWVRVTRNGFSWQILISLWIMGSAVHKFSSVFANCCGFCWQSSNAPYLDVVRSLFVCYPLSGDMGFLFFHPQTYPEDKWVERRKTWLCKCYTSLSITAMYTVQFTTLVPCENSKVVESSYTDVVIAMNEECSIMRHQSNNLGLGSMILSPKWLQVQILIVECLVLEVLKGSYSWVNYSWMNCDSEVLVNLGTVDSWRENW